MYRLCPIFEIEATQRPAVCVSRNIDRHDILADVGHSLVLVGREASKSTYGELPSAAASAVGIWTSRFCSVLIMHAVVWTQMRITAIITVFLKPGPPF